MSSAVFNNGHGDGWVLRLRPESSAISVGVVAGKVISDIRLEIDGASILEGEVHRSENPKVLEISWRSAKGELVATRGHLEQNADDIVAAAAGDYCIAAREDDSDVEFWCTRRWRLEATPVRVSPLGVPPIS